MDVAPTVVLSSTDTQQQCTQSTEIDFTAFLRVFVAFG